MHALLERDLIDGFRLMIDPLVLGGGKCLFGDDRPRLPLRLTDSRETTTGGTSHGLLVEKPELCNSMIAEFLTSDPVPTFAPIRRATTA